MKAYLLIFAMFVVLIVVQVIHYLQFQDEVTKWINKGHRFTAQDGQALCERIAKLETNPQDCRFAK